VSNAPDIGVSIDARSLLLGQIDRCENGVVAGWAAAADRLHEPLRVELLVDGKAVAAVDALEHRPDVEAAGIGGGRFGFHLTVPARYADGQSHELEVRIADSNLLLGGGPLAFQQDPSLASAALHTQTPQTTGAIGFIDEFGPNGITGWAARPDGSHAAVEVQLLADGRVVAQTLANLHRDDLAAASIGRGYHAFILMLPDEYFDDVEHTLTVQDASSGCAIEGGPRVVRFNACDLWARSAAQGDAYRRDLADRALNFCERLSVGALNARLHDTLLALRDWLLTQPQARNQSRAQALLHKLTGLRCRVSMEGFCSAMEICGSLQDVWGATQMVELELVEGDVVLAKTSCHPPKAAGASSPFSFRLPDQILNDEVHCCVLRVKTFGGEVGSWSFLFPHPAVETEGTTDGLVASVWATVPAAAINGAKHAREEPTALELARLALADAIDARTHGIDNDDVLARLQCEVGNALLADGTPNAALEHFAAALAVDGSNIVAKAGEVRALLARGEEAAAARRLHDALEAHPESTELMTLGDEIGCGQRVRRVRTIAFYLPQFHPTRENDEWWGKGFTEWTNVTAATPLFEGHLQPRRPTSLGYYDLRLAEAANAQFELARDYGIDGFCYYYYWFNGRRILERPLNDLVSGRTGPFPFCVFWANEPWTRSWDGATGEVLMAQDHTPESDFQFIQDLAPLLRHPDYIRVDGKLLLLVYRADKLAAPRETTARWREWCRSEGIGELHLCAVQSFGFGDPRPFGFDAAVEFPPHASPHAAGPAHRDLIKDVPGLVENFRGHIYNYQTFATAAIRRPREPYTLHRSAMVAWDNTARRNREADVFHRFSVETFERWMLANARRAATEQTDGVVFVNAWNEWAEGSTMEPEARFGYEILNASRRAMRLANFDPSGSYWRMGYPLPMCTSAAEREREPMLLVGHDTHPSGAQTNLLNMARCLKRQLGMTVHLMVIDGGELLRSYEKVAPVFLIGKDDGWRARLQAELRRLRTFGVRKAICNTVVTGEVVEVLKQEGFRVVSLVHELPALIESYNLQPQCWRVAEKADNIVFASTIVADQFCWRYWPDARKALIAPQGITFNRYHDVREKMRAEVRRELKLPAQCELVMGCGYGDTRKGVDLLVQVASLMVRERGQNQLAFVWVGDLEPTIAPYVQADIQRLGLAACFRITGRTADPARYFVAADLFALTSREDPFPSVVMEAMDACLPVVAFDGAGGYVDIVDEETGGLVPYLDVQAMATALLGYLDEPGRRNRVGLANHALCRERFGYSAYMRKLLALLDGVPAATVEEGLLERQTWPQDVDRPTITAIVPNFNYARYLELRLRTVVAQTLQPDQILVLDDGSTDSSLSIVREMAEVSPIPIRVITSEANTGNPFEQWAKGLAEAAGDLVWIAEADDYCEPTLLETLARELVDPTVTMAWTDSIMVDERGHSHGYQYKQYYAPRYGTKWNQSFRIQGKTLIEDCLLAENVVPNASAVLFRRAAVGQETEVMRQHRFSGDWWFWLCLARGGDLVYRAEPLNYHRRHKGSVMGGVLKDAPRLMQETLAFYDRVQRIMPDLLTPGACAKVLQRLKELDARFRTDAAADGCSSTSVHVGSLREFTARLVAGALDRRARTQDSTILVLSDDVLADNGSALALIRHFQVAGSVRLHVLATGAASIEAVGAAVALAPGARVIYVASSATPSNGEDREAVPADGLQAVVTALVSGLGAGKLVSHGLLANTSIGAVLPGAMRHQWTIVAGTEFNSLLGQLPRQPLVSVPSLRGAIHRCGRALFVGEQAPHAFATLALQSLVPVERLVLRTERAVDRVSEDQTLRFLVLGVWGHADEWRAIVTALRRNSQGTGKVVQLRFLAWGPSLAQLRRDLRGEPGVEIVELYARPRHLARLGDIAVLPSDGTGSQEGARLDFENAGIATCTFEELLEPRMCKRRIEEALHRRVANSPMPATSQAQDAAQTS
jgi:glycosyltransferase involved in cell wall biosynthesis